MLADRVRQTSGAVDKMQFLKALLHFDQATGFTNLKTGISWQSTKSNIDTSIYKFGNGSISFYDREYPFDGRLNSSPDTAFNAISMSNIDFTIEMWVRPIKYMNGYLYYKGNGFAMRLNNSPPFTIKVFGAFSDMVSYDFASNVVLTQYNWNFVKVGRKGTKFFIIVNGNKSEFEIGNKTLADTTSFVDMNTYYGHIDELAVFIGIGDDSTDIPTAPY